MFFNKKKFIIATLSLAVCASFSFNTYAFANAETTEEVVATQQETEKKELSQSELRQVEIIKDNIKSNINVYNKYVKDRQKKVREDIDHNTNQHQNNIKTYRLKIASYMSLGVLSKSDKQHVVFYRNMIQKEKDQLNEENSQLRQKAEKDMLRAKEAMDKKNTALKEKLKTILGDSADSVIRVIDEQNSANLDELGENILQ